MTAPLTGLTILDLSRVLSGPYCTMLAADMGARVIKIEHPVRGDDTRAWGPPFLDGESSYYLSINRNKESVAVDFKTPEGRAIVHALAAKADVLIENFRPGTLDGIGLGYAELSARHPRLIYVSVSGFGQNGPRRDEPGYDAVAQAEGGLMSITGDAGGSAVRLGVAIADIASGLFAFQGLLLALIARGTSGRGQLVDVSLLDSVAALLTYQASRYLLAGDIPRRTGNRHSAIAPYDTFEAADGVLVLAVGNDSQWRSFCRVIEAPHLDEPQYRTNASRVEHYDVLRPILATILRRRPLDTLIAKLREAGVPCGAVRNVAEALQDPQIAARAMIETLNHPTLGALRVLGIPVKLSETPGSVRTAPPLLGQHTRQVLLNDLQMTAADVDRLIGAGVCAAPAPGRGQVDEG
ncbi:MAG TPA: CoA transferase [Vicinamibacterales bacterium]|nr:CoA transferase [Vicinamibacterales bacterium]